jgi:hypothetical protein
LDQINKDRADCKELRTQLKRFEEKKSIAVNLVSSEMIPVEITRFSSVDNFHIEMNCSLFDIEPLYARHPDPVLEAEKFLNKCLSSNGGFFVKFIKGANPIKVNLCQGEFKIQ